ncbi:hypothetical protein [Candidatus Amarobacter glycogenicus]|uniref:hypothetical protein n=1 Tax=Candidatus Amarobacter glycogenicus TaxID=3140699 RepID=UPI002A1847C4|nr:hypothetical protein [Dehalococcoidia bacterium]
MPGRAMLAANPAFELANEAADVTVADLEEDSSNEDWPPGPAVLLAASPASSPPQ